VRPYPLRYARPTSLAEAMDLVASEPEARCLAGGQSLLPLLNLRMAGSMALVDLAAISELDYLRRERGRLLIGAMTRHRALETSAEARVAEPLIPRVAGEIGHLAIRSRGTIGGSLAHADPAAEWPLLAVLLDAELTVQSTRGVRQIRARDFFAGPLATTLEPDEILTGLSLPEASRGSGAGFRELCRRAGDFAIAAVACRLELDGTRRIGHVAVAVGGVDATPRRLEDTEALLCGETPGAELFDEAAEVSIRTVDPLEDIHGSADYRRKMVGVLARRVLRDAALEARAA